MDAMHPAEAQEPGPKTPFYINRDFALLWSGQAISYVGDFVFDTTLILWIASRIAAGQSWAALAVSGLLVCVLAPSLVGGPIAGVFVDRWDKRTTMLWMDAARAGLIGLLVLLSGAVPLPLVAGGVLPTGVQLAVIYTVVTLATVCQQFFGPARMALIGDVVDGTVRTRASGMGQVTMNLAAIIGPPLAAPLLFHWGVQWALLVNALSFVVSFAAITLVHAPPPARSVAPGQQGDLLRELADGIGLVMRNRILRTLLISVVVTMFGVGAVNALDIFFVIQNLHTPASMYGYLTAAFGVGAVGGAVFASVLAQRLNPARLLWACILLAALLLTIYARLTSFWPAVFVLFVLGLPAAALNVSVMPLVLQATPRDMIGRVSSVLQPSVSLASLGSIALSGLLVSTVLSGFHAGFLGMRFGPVDTIFTAGGLIMFTAGLYAWLNLRSVGPPSTVDAVSTTQEAAAPAEAVSIR